MLCVIFMSQMVCHQICVMTSLKDFILFRWFQWYDLNLEYSTNNKNEPQIKQMKPLNSLKVKQTVKQGPFQDFCY